MEPQVFQKQRRKQRKDRGGEIFSKRELIEQERVITETLQHFQSHSSHATFLNGALKNCPQRKMTMENLW